MNIIKGRLVQFAGVVALVVAVLGSTAGASLQTQGFDNIAVKGCIYFSKAKICEEGNFLVFRDRTESDTWFMAYNYSSEYLSFGGGSTGNVKVGINTTSPSSSDSLTVEGDVLVRNGQVIQVR